MPTKPKLGQNFLHDVQAIQRIAAAIGDCTDATVIEIGPGRGAVTQALISRAHHVIAVELDAELADGLRKEFPPDKVTVVEQGESAKEIYHIVGSAEANPADGKISSESPLGKALLGAKVGQKVTVNAPAGEIIFVIKSIA